MKLCIPPKILEQHLVVLGKTGAGKSSALRVLVEYLLDHNKRIVIIDPKGDWYGLKIGVDGKSAGYPIIGFGNFKDPKGEDVPINAQSGKEVAELIASGNRPCIIGFRGWMPGPMTDFWLDFAPALFNANKGELYVVIDEVHNFAPKGKILDPKAGKVIHWTNRIISEGRGLGMNFLIASQRPQKVHNDTLECCETLVAMRVTHPASRQAYKDWIDGNGDPEHGKEVLAGVAKLPRGSAYVWSPEAEFGPQVVEFPMFTTYDSFAPPALQKRVSGGGWSTVNLEEVKAKLAKVIEEKQANDPKYLKDKIASIEQLLRSEKISYDRELRRLQATKTDSEEEQALRLRVRQLEAAVNDAMKIIINIQAQGLDKRGSKEELANAIESVVRQIAGIAERKIEGALASVQRVQSECTRLEMRLRQSLTEGVQVDIGLHKTSTVKVSRDPETRETPEVRRAPSPERAQGDTALAGNDLRPGARRMLAVCVERLPSGTEEKQVAARSAINRNGGSFSSYKSNLVRAGYVRIEGQTWHPTEAGIAYIGDSLDDTPRTTKEVVERWSKKLRPGAQRMLDVLISYKGEKISQEQLGRESNIDPAGGSMSSYLSNLVMADLAVKPERGMVAANKEALFL